MDVYTGKNGDYAFQVTGISEERAKELFSLIIKYVVKMLRTKGYTHGDLLVEVNQESNLTLMEKMYMVFMVALTFGTLSQAANPDGAKVDAMVSGLRKAGVLDGLGGKHSLHNILNDNE